MSTDTGSSQGGKSRFRGVVRRGIPLLLVAAAASVVIVLAVALPARTRDLPATDRPAVPVRIEIVRPVGVSDTFILHGVVEPNRVVKVAAEVSGRIERYGRRKQPATWLGRVFPAGQTVREGQPVTRGDPIVLLNTDLLQAEFDRAKAQADYHARRCARMEDVYRKGVATRTELDECRTQLETSRAALEIAAERLKRATIVAPISGILNDLPEEVGQFVQPGTCVAEIVDIRTAKIVAEVPEKDVSYLKVGDEPKVLVDKAPAAQEMTGRISFIGELADERTRTTPVEVSVDNERRTLRSGQIVRLRLTRRKLTDVIMVPLEVVIPLEKEKVVYVVADGKARRRRVELGFMKGRNVRVLSGLARGDKLIVEGHRYVGPGQKVVIVDSAPAGAAAGQNPRQ